MLTFYPRTVPKLSTIIQIVITGTRHIRNNNQPKWQKVPPPWHKHGVTMNKILNA